MLEGIRVLEIEGQGPAPFCGMTLSDLGAEVIVVHRTKPTGLPASNAEVLLNRGKRSIALDLKDPKDVQTLLGLVECSDVLIESFRPQVMERLGLGPEQCLARNKALVYARMTGYGQTGPLAQAAGHDLTYLAHAGALWYSSKPDDAPITPPTLQGDVPGALYLTIGIMAALNKVRRTGEGEVVDCAITDALAHMQNLLLALKEANCLETERGRSVLDGPHWSNSYQCRDGSWLVTQCLEQKFYHEFLRVLGLSNDPDMASQFDRDAWPAQSRKLTEVIATRDRDEWMELFAGTDACVAPVLSIDDAMVHPHNVSRRTFVTADDVLHGAPAPRFASRPEWTPQPSPHLDADREEVLAMLSEPARQGLVSK